MKIIEAGFLRDQIGMPYDRANEEAIIRNLLALGNLGLPEVQMHLLIGRRKCLEIVSSHAVQFQLEGAARLEMPVDSILDEALSLAEGEELGKLSPLERGERNSSDATGY